MLRRLSDFHDDPRFNGAPEWVVEFQSCYDAQDLTPLEAVKKAMARTTKGHGWTVCHVRTGLKWSVCIDRNEVIEILTEPRPPTTD